MNPKQAWEARPKKKTLKREKGSLRIGKTKNRKKFVVFLYRSSQKAYPTQWVFIKSLGLKKRPKKEAGKAKSSQDLHLTLSKNLKLS